MRKIQRHSRDEMFAHINACRNSNQSQHNYCKHHGIAYSTFQYWAKKFREEYFEDEFSGINPGFIPIKVQPDPVMDQITIANHLHFLFPNGIRVMCSESVHPEVLKTLLNS